MIADFAALSVGMTLVAAVAARATGALTSGGAVAGGAIGVCVSLRFGLAGLAVLGTFFILGTVATHMGWDTKMVRGTTEADKGRRDALRVLGKGAVAGIVALAALLRPHGFGHVPGAAFAGAAAAALADTLGTEIGVLSKGMPRSLPLLLPVKVGTPGAVSLTGLGAAALGAILVATVARVTGLLESPHAVTAAEQTRAMLIVAGAGVAASLLESLGVGFGLRAPGFARNLFTTLAGALLARFLVVL